MTTPSPTSTPPLDVASEGRTGRAGPESPAQATYLHLDRLHKTYGGQGPAAVNDVTLELQQGELLALLGPSGCGKTTTLRMIAGLLEPSSGEVWVDGQNLTDVPVHRRGMGMVFQSYALFPHLDVTANVSFGLEMRGTRRRHAAGRALEALEMVQLGHLAQRKVRELSGGQQQRVALARALVVEPSVLLLDEPLSNLDAKLRDAMRSEIRSLVRRLGVTTVLVTHDQDEALSMADRVAVMRDGRVEQYAAPSEVYRRPVNQFVADFVGRANLIGGVVSQIDGATTAVDVPALGTVHGRARHPMSVGDRACIMVRPHGVQLNAAAQDGRTGLQSWKGTISDTSFTGELVGYSVRVGDLDLASEAIAGPPTRSPGERVQVTWSPDEVVVLPAEPEGGSRW